MIGEDQVNGYPQEKEPEVSEEVKKLREEAKKKYNYNHAEEKATLTTAEKEKILQDAIDNKQGAMDLKMQGMEHNIDVIRHQNGQIIELLNKIVEKLNKK